MKAVRAVAEGVVTEGGKPVDCVLCDALKRATPEERWCARGARNFVGMKHVP